MREIRAAFDVGSGSTKLQVSEVEDTSIIRTLFGQERPLAYGETSDSRRHACASA